MIAYILAMRDNYKVSYFRILIPGALFNNEKVTITYSIQLLSPYWDE